MYPQSHFLFSFLVVSVFVKLGVFDFRVALFVAIFAFLVDVYNLNLFWIVGLGYYTHMILDYAHLNFLKIKGRLSLRFGGFVERIGKFEALFDIFILMGMVLVWI